MKKLLLGIAILTAIIAAIYYSYLFIDSMFEVMRSLGLSKPVGFLAIAYCLWKFCGVLLDPPRRESFIKALPRRAVWYGLLSLWVWFFGAMKGDSVSCFLMFLFLMVILAPEMGAPEVESSAQIKPSLNEPNQNLSDAQLIGEEPRKKALQKAFHRLHTGLVSLRETKLRNQLGAPPEKSNVDEKKG